MDGQQARLKARYQRKIQLHGKQLITNSVQTPEITLPEIDEIVDAVIQTDQDPSRSMHVQCVEFKQRQSKSSTKAKVTSYCPALEQISAEWDPQTLRQACYRENPESAMCVQNFNDSRGLAIRITYRISLRSSSLWEPRHPPLKVVSH